MAILTVLILPIQKHGLCFHFVEYSLFSLINVLVCCMSLESCPFLLGCQVCWRIIVHGIPPPFFLFLQYPLRFLLFHFLFLFVWVLSSWWVWSEVCQFYLHLQRTSSWFTWFFLSYFFNLYFDFLSNIYYFLPSPEFRYWLFFFF